MIQRGIHLTQYPEAVVDHPVGGGGKHDGWLLHMNEITLTLQTVLSPYLWLQFLC